MTQSETVSVADRLTQAATDLRSGARSRAEIVCELIEALGETDELVGKHATVWSDGDIPFSHPHPNQSGLILVRSISRPRVRMPSTCMSRISPTMSWRRCFRGGLIGCALASGAGSRSSRISCTWWQASPA